VLVEVDDDVTPGVGVGSGTAPGEFIVPADAETLRIAATIAMAHVRRNLLTILYPP
jgi:hypothetical protein